MSSKHICRNNTSFPLEVQTKLKQLYESFQQAQTDESSDDRFAKVAKYHQYLVRHIFTDKHYGMGIGDNARGLLIKHTMGMGKTILAILVAISLYDVYEPVVILPKSLEKNFVGSIRKLVRLMRGADYPAEQMKQEQDEIITRFTFIAMDAYNMANQIVKKTTGIKSGPLLGSLDNKLVIVDEAHNLFRGIINSSSEKSNARQFYNIVMDAKNIRILFLTGTPASKDPFELVPCFNMLAGKDILPAQYDIFAKHFIDRSTNIIKNREKLANRLLGMVSSASYRDLAKDGKPTEVPEKYETKIIKVEMSKPQYKQYILMRDLEIDEEKKKADRAGKYGDRPPPP